MTQHFATPEPVLLEVSVAAGDIQIATVDGDQSTITLDGPARLIEATQVELVGDRLVVQQRRKSPVRWFGNRGEQLHVEARIPHRSRVQVATAASDATLEGEFAGLDTKSVSGDVMVRGELDGDAQIKTVSGNARLAHVAGDLTMQTVSGDLSANAVDGSVFVRSVSGDVHLGSVREGEVNVQSVSGDVELGIAAGTSFDVDAGTASGDLRSELALSDAPTGEAERTLVIRSNSVSGGLRLFRAA